MKEFKDRVAVVTGAASGIGRGLAERFALEGMNVVLADVEKDALDDAARGLEEKGAKVLSVVADVSDGKAMDDVAAKTYDAFGACHILINNAGVSVAGPAWEHPESDWAWVLGVNLWGVIHGIRAFVPRMIAGGDEGHIVNTASMAGLTSAPLMSIYCVSKQGTVALSECLYHDLQMSGAPIGVSVLCPGWVTTKIVEAERNRPAEGPHKAEGELHPAGEQLKEVVRGLLQTQGLKVTEVVDQVVQAILDDRFYILTHPSMKVNIERRFRAIMEETNPTVDPIG